MTDTASVIEDHLSAFARGDMIRILNTYDPNAVIITERGVLRGRDAIREEFHRLFEEFSSVSMTDAENIDTLSVVDDFGFLVWHGETPKTVYEYVTATFYVPHDTIDVQTMAAQTTNSTSHVFK